MAKIVEISDLMPAPSFNEHSYSKRILSQLSERREKNRQNQSWNIPEVITHNKSHFWVMLDWLQDSLPRYLKDPNVKTCPPDNSGSLQEIDLLREFYLEIAEHGLPATFERWGPSKPKPPPSGTVLIVGAGMSGMAAAYELEKAGYKDVKILEMSQRFGGRVKTLDMKDGFDRGLHTDAGAMRIPLPPKQDRPINESIHYLTDFYSQKRFGLKQVPFSNQSDNAYYCFYGDLIQISDWNKDPKMMFNKYWPGWNSKPATSKFDTINEYYETVAGVVVDLLKLRLSWVKDLPWIVQAIVWSIWTQNWCQFSFGSFLRSTLTGIKSQLAFYPIVGTRRKAYDAILDRLEPFLPWPEEAITAYNIFNYTLSEDVSLVAVLQDGMGKWWSDAMHSLNGGLSALPEAFAGQGGVEKLIVYNRMVTKVEVVWNKGNVTSARVHGVFRSSGEPFVEEGRSVILTVPLHVLRGIEIVSINGDDSRTQPEQFPMEFQKAIEDISYSPSTKIMLQYDKQFWHEDAGAIIDGGFSKTNMPIGQLHYPTILSEEMRALIHLRVPDNALVNQKGILMVYTWKAEALLWGALTEDQAILLAVNQIERIHPNSKRLFQVGKRQAWANDPTTLGAFAMLRPREYISVLYLMLGSWQNIFFAGEAISFANGWIQGALGSGLRAAFQLYYRDQVSQ